MKNFKSLILLISLSIFASYINAEVIIPNEDEKKALTVYLIKNPSINNPVFTTDIDNNLTISKTNPNVLAGKIISNACLLNDMPATNYHSDEETTYYKVYSLYAIYGIENIVKILSDDSEKDIVNFANSLGVELEVETKCKNSKNKNVLDHYFAELLESPVVYVFNYEEYDPDLFFISDYLYNLLLENSELLQGITDADIVGTWTFDEMKTLSDNYLEFLAEGERDEKEFQQRILNLAEEKSKDFMGSLNLSQNYNQSQKFCTLNYSGDDAVAVIGYRLMGDEMTIDKNLIDYYKEKEITLNYNENENYFDKTFDNISEAFLSIKPKLKNAIEMNMVNADDYCNIFIDYPENLLKLKNAIERDVGSYMTFGNLFDKNTTSNKYALSKGFDDYDQYSFALQINATYQEIKSLISKYQILNQSEFKKIQDEIVSTGYSNDTSLSKVLTYLSDLNSAQQQGMNVVDFKNARVDEKERLAKIAREQEQLRQAEFAKEYPYTATLTCGMGGGDHINIFGCFAGSGSYGADTELEITNGQNYQMYKVYNLGQAGNEYRTGLEINLKESFKIFAQNSAEYLILSLKIIDNATGATVYEDSAAQYGVISITN
tara:strand:- start:156 stop:1967 length:1812 start_codon:yes stop_codon:yes gene_type:complete